MKKHSIAVIGIGYWGPNIVRNLLKISSIKDIYVCDIKKDNLFRIKKNFPNIITTSLSALLSNKKITAAIIATPIESHFYLAKKVLSVQKHALVEKPITASAKETQELINLAKKQKKILMVGHTFVYSEAIKKIKETLNAKKLGKIYYYDSTRINLGLLQKNVNVVWDLAPHDLSIINYLFSEKVLSVQAFGSKFIEGNYEMAHIFLRLEKNISAHIYISWLSPVKIRSILIGGNKKMISYNDIEPTEKIKIYDKGIIPSPKSITPFSPAYRSGDVIIPRLEQNEALFNQLSHFIECIENNIKPLTDGYSGLYVVKLLEAINKSLETKTEIFL